ncbi:MAG: YhcH/YjgK/YiaL family protein [Rikenellaceae bacterium]|jgi:YhcH/YjgK/YiaL family protein|nr:YhcH/YjgK/YiaL family protein [Rikenellaceae bacterium]
MVIDSLTNAAKYAGLNPHFAKAFYWIANTDLSKLELGRYEIDGANVYAMIQGGPLKNKADARMEAHDNYIDIQICLEGKETFGWLARAVCKNVSVPYNAEKDIVFFSDAETTCFSLVAGQMAILFPEDGHAPMIGEGTIRKCIIKVRA